MAYLRAHRVMIATFASSWLSLVAGCECSSPPLPADGGPDAGHSSSTDTGLVRRDSGPGCGLVTCASAHATCGPVGDGCGGTLDCGSCTAPQSCGGGGVPSTCGGMAGCVPMDCAAQHVSCGPAGDGCGGQLDCGSCAAPDTCGGGGVASTCGHGATAVCTPRTCAAAGAACGSIADGCGALLDCGSCAAPDTCGGGGVGYQCGHPPMCVPRTCADLGATCGQVADGCGGLTPSCGACTAPAICGGSGVPNVCGAGVDAGVAPCTTGLCTSIPTCGAGGTTTITGVVTAPGHDDVALWGSPDPLYGVHVYIPNGPVPAFTPGVSCDRCGAPLPGNPLVSVTTGPDGVFTLTGTPAGANIPLVIQLGRWRRQVTIPSVSPCTVNTLPNALTHMPRNHGEGDIPLIAMVTGDVDVMECVLRKIGIEDTEYSAPASRGGSGRVRFYVNNGADIANPRGTMALPQSSLVGSSTELDQYDMVLFACPGSRMNQSMADQQRVIDYTSAGGRVFATHFNYVWLTNDPSPTPVPFSQTADWQVDQARIASVVASVDTGFPRGMAFAQWLQNVGASSIFGQITVNVVRHDFNAVNPPAQRWLYTPTMPVHYSFDTPIAYPPLAPIPASSQCGRVVFSDFHVEDARGAGGSTFPTECTDGPMTPQEKVLEFMLFDLASCIQPPTCTPRTCADVGATCGPIGDGCGGVIASCGTCTAPDTCGGGGIASVCGHTACTPATCASLGFSCGPAGDGCGGLLDCGPCTAPATCGGGGTPGVCGHSNCVPLTCATIPTTFGPACGVIADGCGGSMDCGSCVAPATCGGGGHANECGVLG